MSADAPVVPTRLNPDLSIELQLEVSFFLKWDIWLLKMP